MESKSDGLRFPPPWISPAAGRPDREVQPVIFVQQRKTGGGYDPDAQAWITAVEGASGDNQPLEEAIKQALNTYVQALKTTGLGGASGSIWSQNTQLLLPCGPRTLAGSLRPLKGPVPTNGNGSTASTQFVAANHNRKNGLGKPLNGSSYLINNVPTNSLGTASHALFAYGAITATSGQVLLGNTSGALLLLDGWLLGQGRTFRSGPSGQYPASSSTAAATCVIGSRTSATSSALYVDGNTFTNASNSSITGSAQSVYTYSYNSNGAPGGQYSSDILQAIGIFSIGLNAVQASALRSATATYVAAVAAAIP
jgi:hypothetical protein